MFPGLLETEMISGWPIQRSDSGGCGTRTPSRGFVRKARCAVCSVIRRRASSPSCGAQKNDLRRLRPSAIGLVRPARSAGTRSVLWRHAHLPGGRGTAPAVPQVRWREARAVGVPGGQPVLYQALCLLRGIVGDHGLALACDVLASCEQRAAAYVDGHAGCSSVEVRPACRAPRAWRRGSRRSWRGRAWCRVPDSGRRRSRPCRCRRRTVRPPACRRHRVCAHSRR